MPKPGEHKTVQARILEYAGDVDRQAVSREEAFLKEYILFAEKDVELNKYILRQHQVSGVERVVRRAPAASSGTRRAAAIGIKGVIKTWCSVCPSLTVISRLKRCSIQFCLTAGADAKVEIQSATLSRRRGDLQQANAAYRDRDQPRV